VTIGTRQSKLAVWQADYVAAQLHTLHPGLIVMMRFMSTRGDQVLDKPLPEIGGKGLFTAELEMALHDGTIDLAVHSLKDLPTALDPAFTLGAIPVRASPFDALISRSGATFSDLPIGAMIGTSSLRRIAQLKAARPDIQTTMLRGNVPTRIDKALAVDGSYDAIILARAGLDRLALVEHIAETLDPVLMLPAPAQGALGIQCRADDTETLDLLAPLDHMATRIAVEAERAFLQSLDSGCRLPVAALATLDADMLHLIGRVISPDGKQSITVSGQSAISRQAAVALGVELAQAAITQGADKLLAAVQLSIQEQAP
jgi:hydroxymethylbilane synthase